MITPLDISACAVSFAAGFAVAIILVSFICENKNNLERFTTMKHNDALYLICPFATKQHVTQPKQSPIAGMGGTPPEITWGTVHANCVGEKCMAWQSTGDKEFSSEGFCRLIRI
jgi:hypothetical protein